MPPGANLTNAVHLSRSIIPIASILKSIIQLFAYVLFLLINWALHREIASLMNSNKIVNQNIGLTKLEQDMT